MTEKQNQLNVLLKRFEAKDISDDDLCNLIYMLQQNIHNVTLRIDKSVQTLKDLEKSKDFFLTRLDDAMEYQKEREYGTKYRELGKSLIERFGDGVDVARLIIDEEDKTVIRAAFADSEREEPVEERRMEAVATTTVAPSNFDSENVNLGSSENNG